MIKKIIVFLVFILLVCLTTSIVKGGNIDIVLDGQGGGTISYDEVTVEIIEHDPIWSANFTNMQTGCSAGEYVYGIYTNGTFKCRADTTGEGASYNLTYDTMLEECPDGNYSYGYDSGGNIQCRSDIQGGSGTDDTKWNLEGIWLYNSSDVLTFNITLMNATIEMIAVKHNATSWTKEQDYGSKSYINATAESHNTTDWVIAQQYASKSYVETNASSHNATEWVISQNYLTFYTELDPTFVSNLTNGFSNNIVPRSNEAFSLGALINRWLNLFVNTIFGRAGNFSDYVNATFFYGDIGRTTGHNTYNETIWQQALNKFNISYLPSGILNLTYAKNSTLDEFYSKTISNNTYAKNTSLNNYMPTAGGTFTGSVNMSNHTIVGLLNLTFTSGGYIIDNGSALIIGYNG